MRLRLIARVAGVALTGLGVVGCGLSVTGKVGAPPEPVTLTMADANHGIATTGVLDFVHDVDADSHGAVRIKLVAAPESADKYEVNIVRWTAAGRFDLAWVGGRVLDEVGVPAAGALQVPFLIDSYALERRVVEGPIGAQLTRQMSAAGVVGVGLLADHMRYFAAVRPVTSPAVLVGEAMRAFYSASQILGWQALHAVPLLGDGSTESAIEQIHSGGQFGLESDPVTWSQQGDVGNIVYTVGAPIWPLTAAIIAAPKRFHAQAASTQALLRTAIAQANAEVLGTAAADDTVAISGICDAGGRVVVLNPAQRATFVKTGSSIASRIAKTEPYGGVIARIEQLKGSSAPQPPPVAAGCAPTAPPVSPANAATARALTYALRPGTVYRARINFKVINAQLGILQAEDNAGTYTWRFSAGNHFTLTERPQFRNAPGAAGPPATGTFRVVGVQLKVTFNPPYAGKEVDRCSIAGTTVTCQWIGGNDGWTTAFGLGGMTTPLMLVRG